MPDNIGEFEYVKPPHFYMDQASEEELPPFFSRRRKVEPSNPLINGRRPGAKKEEPKEPVAEIEIEINDDKTTTKKIVVTRTRKPTRGCPPKLQGQEQEIAEKYLAGRTLQQLSDEYGASMPCISATIKRGGAVVRSAGRPKKKQ